MGRVPTAEVSQAGKFCTPTPHSKLQVRVPRGQHGDTVDSITSCNTSVSWRSAGLSSGHFQPALCRGGQSFLHMGDQDRVHGSWLLCSAWPGSNLLGSEPVGGRFLSVPLPLSFSPSLSISLSLPSSLYLSNIYILNIYNVFIYLQDIYIYMFKRWSI